MGGKLLEKEFTRSRLVTDREDTWSCDHNRTLGKDTLTPRQLAR